jgi:hypothetical protein
MVSYRKRFSGGLIGLRRAGRPTIRQRTISSENRFTVTAPDAKKGGEFSVRQETDRASAFPAATAFPGGRRWRHF